MKKIALIPALALVSILGACAGGQEVSSRGAASPLPMGLLGGAPAQGGAQMVQPRYNVQAVNVTVPETLRVSEANMFYPMADIVWRGEPLGNRHAQIAAIFRDAAAQGTAQMHQGRPVVVDVEVRRFHSLTEKAKFVTGGVHSIRYAITVRDAQTGAVLDGPRLIATDIDAWGGRALAEEARGVTDKMLITNHLRDAMARELSAPVAVARPVTVAAAPAAAMPAGSVPVGRTDNAPSMMPLGAFNR